MDIFGSATMMGLVGATARTRVVTAVMDVPTTPKSGGEQDAVRRMEERLNQPAEAAQNARAERGERRRERVEQARAAESDRAADTQERKTAEAEVSRLFVPSQNDAFRVEFSDAAKALSAEYAGAMNAAASAVAAGLLPQGDPVYYAPSGKAIEFSDVHKVLATA